ncbi:lytic transglycosylase domain-containing protein [Streptomyces sp. TRM 70351]|nr:lytic transglycosylase domain-containing protein [Streptomyces sp. TRM 70351]MEE1930527.1 lytic transglycosylase domain-containing protein [Streptomyces sp. TRM 70351]
MTGRTGGRLRRGVTSTAVAAAAMVALTASQAPGITLMQPGVAPQDPGSGADDVPLDDSYHTELPPLQVPGLPGQSHDLGGGPTVTGDAEGGIPATVLAAYQNAESALRSEQPGCNLPWQLLAAIGKVESGHARGGAVDAGGTTTAPILGPVLDGNGFARINDTDAGAYDGDATFDRAVGPMQFIPSTWAAWGADGNGDGADDPNNIYDAALAAGRYLCANGRDLSDAADLERAVLSYNQSREYLNTVLSWLEFYRKGVHEVPDGSGPLPESPGAGNEDRPAERPVSPKPAQKPAPAPAPETKPKPKPKPSPDGTPGQGDGGTGDGGGKDDGGTGDGGQQPGGPLPPWTDLPGDGDPGEEPKDPDEPGDPGDPGEEPDEPGDPGDPGEEPDEPGDPGEEPGDPGDPDEEPGDPGGPGEEPDDPDEPKDPGEPGEEEPGEPGECPTEPADPDAPATPGASEPGTASPAPAQPAAEEEPEPGLTAGAGDAGDAGEGTQDEDADEPGQGPDEPCGDPDGDAEDEGAPGPGSDAESGEPAAGASPAPASTPPARLD